MADWETLVNDGIEARNQQVAGRKQVDGGSWKLGDLAGQVETHYGEADIQKYAERIGVPPVTLRDYRRVAEAYELVERSTILSWGHHQVLSARNDRLKWLPRAAEADWSIAELRDELRKNPEGVEEGTYRTIVLDPPWPMERIQREVRPNQTPELAYPTMSVDDIRGWKLKDYAAPEGCHVYLWTTHKYLPQGFGIFNDWGVKYECLLTWVKNVGFTPFSFMYSTEHVLFGRVGSLSLMKLGERTDIQGKVREHSRKPDEFYDLVRTVSPGPRLDVFSREPMEGFDQLGDEEEHFAVPG